MGCTVIRGNAWPAGEHKIVLSFDDGPNGAVSHRLLDVLARHDVKATFCYVGRNAARQPEIVRRAVDEGHELAVHSYSRQFPTFFNYPLLLDDIEKTRHALREAAGQPNLEISLYRPPSGLVTPTVLTLLRNTHMRLAHISFYARDSALEGKDLEALMQKTKAGIIKRDGASIVFHESRFRPTESEDNAIDKEWLPDAIDRLIVWAKHKGYEFALFKDAPTSASNY